MLFVHGSLAMGGIETFYVRMAQGRKRQGLITKFLLLSPESRSDPELVKRARQCAEVYFLDDIILSPFSLFGWMVIYQFSLLYPLRRSVLKKIFDGIDSAHVSNGYCAHMVFRLTSALEVNLPLSIGLYHSMEFSWGAHLRRLPLFEKYNREIFYSLYDVQGLIFFNERMIDLYSEVSGKDFGGVNLFPLGVVDNLLRVSRKKFSENLLIGSVGRLVNFKSYNIWMLDVIKDLRALGVSVSYSIYGYGPMEQAIAEKIKILELEDYVSLEGSLDYSKFSEVVSGFDVFVGSGTALIEAAGLGIPSIVGIENTREASTYGFLSEIPGFSYNEDNLYSKKSVLDVLLEFNSSDEFEKAALSEAHIKKAEMFSMDTCVSNFELAKPSIALNSISRIRSSLHFRFLYSSSVILFSLYWRLRGRKLSQVVRHVE